MTSDEAVAATNEFKAAVIELNTMENSGAVFTPEQIRQQRERVALIEASLRTALLNSGAVWLP